MLLGGLGVVRVWVLRKDVRSLNMLSLNIRGVAAKNKAH